MIDSAGKFANLSPEQRAKLERMLLQGRAGDAKKTGIPRRDPSQPCPLSFAQQRLWFLDQYEPGSPLYNIYDAMRLKGSLDVPALERALDAIVARHESLRTTFATVDDVPTQIVTPSAKIPFTVVDLSDRPADARESDLLRLMQEDAERPFDLGRDVMFRAHLFRLAPHEHVLLTVIHHIAADGWSHDVILRELAAFYDEFSGGPAAALPELPIQYGDFAVWQRRWLEDGVLAKQLEYWKKQLAGAPGVLELPTDYPRPAIETFHGAVDRLMLPPNLATRLKDLCRTLGVTPFMLLLSAFQMLLSRYTGAEDLLVGTPIANRSRVEIEGLIGFFVNTLVLRGDLSGNPTFREFVGRVREATLDAYSHQDVPFEKLVEELQPDRNLSHAPLYQVLFVLQNNPQSLRKLKDLAVSMQHLDSHISKFDLSLVVADEERGLRLFVEYNTDLFHPDTVRRMLGHYRTLLEGIVAAPDRRISEYPLLSADEQQQILRDWNATRDDAVPDRILHRLFEAQAQRTPDAVAVSCGNERVTYGELNARANRLARHLQGLGVGPEVLVGVCVDRTPEMLVSLLGILKAGGAYVPLDPDFPTSRLDFMIEDSRIKVLVTQSDLRDAVSPHSAATVCLDVDAGKLAGYADDNVACASAPDHLAYVLYTSGSTGKPKGVQIPHGAVCNFLHSMRLCPGLDSGDVLLAVTTLSFDIAGLELFLPLMVGARVALVSREVATDAQRLGESIRTSGATVLQATPATWRMLLEAGTLPKGLKILCGGEALSRELADALTQHSDSVWNMYGPTETTIWSTVDKVEAGQPIRIGRPIANTQVYVLDKNRQPVPVGIPGELYIGGDGLARGYLNRPELTAEKFVDDPFQPGSGSKLYRTGDLARWREDGRLECLGRIDHQVKIRGFRIELGEIESVLLAQPGVRQAVVIAREDTPGDKRLAAYLVPEDGVELAAEGLRTALAAQLPDYMVPSSFTTLAAMPLTPNGKVDRLALPAPGGVGVQMSREYTPPSTPIEEVLCQTWAEVLNVERVGVHDNFFQLGGHSLLATRVVSRIRGMFEVELPLRTLFQSPTVAEFAVALLQLFAETAEFEDDGDDEAPAALSGAESANGAG